MTGARTRRIGSILAGNSWNRLATLGVHAAMKRTLPGLVVVLLLLAACAASGASPGSSQGESPGASPPPSSDGSDGGGIGAIEHPTDSEAVLVVDSAGGFVPVQFMATRLPAFVLLGDGRVIMQGMQT
ncbi:MAG: hypothetical protein ABIZ57_05715, partial [Candidatus Limnocylindria bacterium]